VPARPPARPRVRPYTARPVASRTSSLSSSFSKLCRLAVLSPRGFRRLQEMGYHRQDVEDLRRTGKALYPACPHRPHHEPMVLPGISSPTTWGGGVAISLSSFFYSSRPPPQPQPQPQPQPGTATQPSTGMLIHISCPSPPITLSPPFPLQAPFVF